MADASTVVPAEGVQSAAGGSEPMVVVPTPPTSSVDSIMETTSSPARAGRTSVAACFISVGLCVTHTMPYDSENRQCA